MTKVTDIEQLKSLTAKDEVYIIKEGNDKRYYFASIHPCNYHGGVVLIWDANISTAICVSKYDIEKDSMGDIYIGEYNDVEFVGYLIESLEKTNSKHSKKMDDLIGYLEDIKNKKGK
jgi:hypothetical protein